MKFLLKLWQKNPPSVLEKLEADAIYPGCHDPKEDLGTASEGEVPVPGREAQRSIKGFLALHMAGPLLYVFFMGFQLHAAVCSCDVP